MMIDVSTGKVSLRARKKGVEVLTIAKKYGGGGHPSAGGFELNAETFDKFVKLK